MSVKALSTKFSESDLWRRISYFTLGGFANTFVDFFIFNTLLLLFPTHQSRLIVGYSMIGFVIANLQSYWIHRNWTFRSVDMEGESSHKKQFGSFFLISMLSLGINSLTFLFLQNMLGNYSDDPHWLNAEKLLASGFGMVTNYMGYQWFVFKKKGHLSALLQNVQCCFHTDECVLPKYTLVIPAYNEMARIRPLLCELANFQKNYNDLEIIIVDDGSTDETSKGIGQYHNVLDNFSHYRLTTNWGKGGAVRLGLSKAKGDLVFFCDADLSFPLEQIHLFEKELNDGTDIVVGHRSKAPCQPSFRKLISKLFRKVVRILRLTNIQDTQCGFKGFRREALQAILPRTYCTDFAFDIELLALAQKEGLTIAEKEIEWIHRDGSTVRLNHVIQMLLSLVSIRFRLLPTLSLDMKIAGVLFLLAFLVRLPYLYSVPHFIDEWGEVRLAAQISRGELFPLHNTAHDIGAFYNYIIAGLFLLFGQSLFVPRLFVAVMSAGTVILTYCLARQWMGPKRSALVALLLATNSMHILVTHMAWSNDITPFFVILALLLTMKALSNASFVYWILMGLAWSIALQTHSSVVAVLIGVFFYVGHQMGFRKLFRDRRFRWAFGTFLVGYSNMIVHNIQSPLDSVFWIHRKDYALNSHLSIQVILQNMKDMFIELLRALASSFPDGVGFTHILSQAVMGLFVVGLIFGCYLFIKIPNGGLLLAVLISSFAVIPLFNSRYVFFISTRYIAYLFPICFLAIILGLHSPINRLVASKLWISVWKRAILLGLTCMLFLGLPLHHFYRYAAEYVRIGEDNSAEYATVKSLLKHNKGLDPVIVDIKAKQGKAVSEMLRVKGVKIHLIGKGPADVQALHGKTESLDLSGWASLLAKHQKDAWYVLSSKTSKEITKHFQITWQQSKMISGANGKPVYFIGRIKDYKRTDH